MKSVCEGINENSHQILDGWNLQDQAMSVDAERKWCFYSCLLPPWWDENLHSAETQKVLPSKASSHLTYFISRPKLPIQNRLRSLPFGVPTINARLLVFCISLTMRHIIFVIRWTSRVRRAAPSKRSGAEVLGVCTSAWGCLVWLVDIQVNSNGFLFVERRRVFFLGTERCEGTRSSKVLMLRYLKNVCIISRAAIPIIHGPKKNITSWLLPTCDLGWR